MAKALEFIIMVMIAVAISVSPVMGCGNYNCNPSHGRTPNTPSVPAGSIPGGSGNSCPINALKLGACVDLLGGLVHVGIGDPAVNQCCPVLTGVLGLEAALCLCTTIRVKLLNLNIILPLALELFVQCGITPPPGFTCPPLH